MENKRPGKAPVAIPTMPATKSPIEGEIARYEQERKRGFSVKPDSQHPTILESARAAAKRLGYIEGTHLDAKGRHTFTPPKPEEA